MEPNIRACGEGWLQDEQRVLVMGDYWRVLGFWLEGFSV